MSINTKLVLLLTPAVGAVMLAASFLNLRQRETALETAFRDEMRAHAVTLQIALEENYQNGRDMAAQALIDRLRENSRVYSVLLFDEKGTLRAISRKETAAEISHSPEVARVLETLEPLEFTDERGGRKFISVIMPIRPSAAESRGAVEIVKPLALIESDIAQARLNWLATTLLLLAAIFLVVYLVLTRSLTRPIRSLLDGARAIGKGDLAHRVDVSRSDDELSLLATEFNRMADNLAAQRRAFEAEAENRLRLERELRHSERLASVGRLAAGIAHELGAPLNVIDARAEQLIERPETPRDKQVRNLGIIRTQSARIARIVRQLLNLARPYDLRFESLLIGEVVRSAAETFETERGISVEFGGPGDLAVVGDADFLRQVFVNIFQNAQHAMKGTGTVRVDFREAVRDGKRFASVAVSDTGEGIAAADLERIFDPFFTTKDVGEGTGLGLAVSRRIVEEHGGAIEASGGREGGGATFTVHLPAA